MNNLHNKLNSNKVSQGTDIQRFSQNSKKGSNVDLRSKIAIRISKSKMAKQSHLTRQESAESIKNESID